MGLSHRRIEQEQEEGVLLNRVFNEQARGGTARCRRVNEGVRQEQEKEKEKQRQES